MVEADIAHSRSEGGIFCGICDGEGHMVGIIDFVPRLYGGDPSRAFLSLLMIAQQYRGYGLGAWAVRWVEGEIAKDGQVRSILCGVQTNNPAAIRFWERMGYQIVGGPELMPDQTTVFHLHKELPGQRHDA
jgi:ribosomal protein S18 acetylase RimI-like enzyme